MALKVHDKIVPANDTFRVIDAEDVEYQGSSLVDYMFLVLTESEYYDRVANNTLNPNTPYLIVSDDYKEA